MIRIIAEPIRSVYAKEKQNETEVRVMFGPKYKLSYGTPSGNFINVGCMMPYMDYTPRTLDEIISGDEEYWKTV